MARFLRILKNLRTQKESRRCTRDQPFWTSRMPRLIPQLDGLLGMWGVDRWVGILAPAVKLMLIPCTKLEPLYPQRFGT